MNRLQGMKIAASLVTACMGVGAASAGGMNVPKIDHAPTLKECGACHMVYSPQMLPQRSWEAMMSNLDNHFGDNAQLDEPTRADVLGYLLANAADAPGQSRYKWPPNTPRRPAPPSCSRAGSAWNTPPRA